MHPKKTDKMGELAKKRKNKKKLKEIIQELYSKSLLHRKNS